MISSLRMLLWMTLLTGVIYPLIITGIAKGLMKNKAEGQLLKYQEKIVGSLLIAQKFETEKYFWPRPSSIDYNPLSSGGSNLGPTSAALKKVVEERKISLTKVFDGEDLSKIPAELLFSSGSGLDPHISPTTAYFQLDRVLKARNLTTPQDKEALIKLIEDLTHKTFGPPVVNVLQLNLQLDSIR